MVCPWKNQQLMKKTTFPIGATGGLHPKKQHSQSTVLTHPTMSAESGRLWVLRFVRFHRKNKRKQKKTGLVSKAVGCWSGAGLCCLDRECELEKVVFFINCWLFQGKTIKNQQNCRKTHGKTKKQKKNSFSELWALERPDGKSWFFHHLLVFPRANHRKPTKLL